jgi:hypothetical protein
MYVYIRHTYVHSDLGQLCHVEGVLRAVPSMDTVLFLTSPYV